jgi:hypothetical protein
LLPPPLPLLLLLLLLPPQVQPVFSLLGLKITHWLALPLFLK